MSLVCCSSYGCGLVFDFFRLTGQEAKGVGVLVFRMVGSLMSVVSLCLDDLGNLSYTHCFTTICFYWNLEPFKKGLKLACDWFNPLIFPFSLIEIINVFHCDTCFLYVSLPIEYFVEHLNRNTEYLKIGPTVLNVCLALVFFNVRVR